MTNYALLVVAVTLLSVVQIIIKFRFNAEHGEIPFSTGTLPAFLLQMLRDPYLWAAGIMLVTAAFLWYAAISRMSLGVAFTFAALSYPMVMAGSHVFLGESFALPQVLGCGLIVCGLVLVAAYS